MVDKKIVSNPDEFVEEAVPNEDLDLSDEGARELWRVWTFRYQNGAEDDVLVALPSWFAGNEFDKRWPYFFAQVEYDEEEKDAVLFSDARLIDVNVIENEIWDQVTITDTLEVIDQTDNDHIDEQGLIWIPRSLLEVFDRNDDPENSSLTDISGPN